VPTKPARAALSALMRTAFMVTSSPVTHRCSLRDSGGDWQQCQQQDDGVIRAPGRAPFPRPDSERELVGTKLPLPRTR